VAQSGEPVLSKINAGEANFAPRWNELGGTERHDRLRWWAANRDRITTAC